MNNFDKVKRDALNELNAEQSQQLIKQHINIIFISTYEINERFQLIMKIIDFTCLLVCEFFQTCLLHLFVFNSYCRLQEIRLQTIDGHLMMQVIQHAFIGMGNALRIKVTNLFIASVYYPMHHLKMISFFIIEIDQINLPFA